jgi:hypothetical protein
MMATTTRGREEVSQWERDPAAQELVDNLHRLVERNGARWHKLMLLEAAGLILSAPLAYLLLFFLLDNLFHLPAWGRVLANLGFLAGLAWLVVDIVRRWRRVRLTEDRVALAMERRTPGGVQNRLINAVQIARDARCADAAYRQALVEENYARLQQIGLQQAARFKPALIRLGVAGGLILMGLCFWLFQPAHFANAAARFLLPFADIDPMYRTRLTVEPGNVEAIGEVTLRITIRGERPARLTVLRNVDGKRTSEVVNVERGARLVTYTLRDIEQTQEYAVQGGDFTSPYYRIEVPRTVGLSLVRVRYEYPDYTGLGPKTVESAGGDLEALQGTSARVTFVLDQPVDEATLMLERPVPGGKANTKRKSSRLELERLSPTEYRGTFVFQSVTGYRLETRQGKRPAERGSFHALRVLTDQEPKLELTGLEQRSEVQLDAVLPLQITARDDYGLVKVGLFLRRCRADEERGGAGWRPLRVWKMGGKRSLRTKYDLAVATQNVSEGEKLEVALRGIDTDPLKKGRWITGTVYGLQVGGEGVLLQIQYEQIVRTEKELRKIIRDQKSVVSRVSEWIGKLDGKGELRWDDTKNLSALHAAVKEQGGAQERVRRSASRTARAMVTQAGNLRIGFCMLADTEMIRAIRILDSVATRDQPQGKRATLAEARTTQERTIRSLQEILEQYQVFRSDWELAHMIPFTKMLADRQAKLRDLSIRARSTQSPDSSQAHWQRTSASRRQAKILELCRLIQPAFKGLADRLEDSESILSAAFKSGAATLASATLQDAMREAIEETKEGQWRQAAKHQEAAAKALAALHARLRQAQLDAARKALAALREKAKSDLEAQKTLEKLKPGSGDLFIKDYPTKMKIDEIIRLREVADRKKMTNDEEGKMLPKEMFGEVDPKTLELKKDSGVRQDPDTLQLGDSRGKTKKFPDSMDTKENKVKPFIQDKFKDLVGKLLEEADELGKDYQSLNLSTNRNNNDPGEIGKQAGRFNSTGSVAATGNKKPPTADYGGVSRTGRQGARAHGMVAGKEGVNRRGRDVPLEGKERVGDQAGKLKMYKSEDMQKEASTGIGGKKVESDDTHFSIADAGKWTDDIADRMDKPQKKNSIVERQGGKLDPRIAAKLRDLNSKQEQVIERLKAIKKELKNLYLPTDHLDDLVKKLNQNLERLRQRPGAELFRLQMRTLDRLRSAVRVFRGANAGFEPSLPRQQVIRGRVLDEPARQTLPGYEEAVKRYYQKLAVK